MQIPGAVMDEKGQRVNIHRAWPRGDGRLTLEGRELASGRVRAGHIDADGRAVLVPFRVDPALPGLASGDAGDLLVHRLKRRAVVRSDGQYGKFLAAGKAPAVARAHLAAAAGLAGTGLRVPDVVSSDACSVTLSEVPGISLHELGRNLAIGGGKSRTFPVHDDPEPVQRWARAWELWAQSWPEFVRASPDAGLACAAHAAEDEIRTVEQWIGFAVSFDALGVSEGRLRSASASVTRLLLAGSSPARLAHRDLHDKQILVDPAAGTVGIIDCDTLAVAEPALDLANLSVHLDFRRAQGMLPADAAALGREHVWRAAEELQVPNSRFAAYAAATALRLACIYAFRPPYRDLAREWFIDVEASLKEGTSLP